MKNQLRKLFLPILKLFESGTGSFEYRPSHRIALIVMGSLFTGLAILVFFFAQGADPAYMIPVLVFGLVGLMSLVIGVLGEDRAVAKIWGSK